jgi:hypothetical protein
MNCRPVVAGSLLIVMLGATKGWAQHPAMPAGMTHEEHLALIQREAEMKPGHCRDGVRSGRDHPSFRAGTNWRYIEVQANNPADSANRDAIRTHLKAIADEFASGDFSKPFMTHGENPPGIETMRRLKATIRFTFEEVEAGGRVRIRTTDSDALKAIHDFLRYQIKEHATGDSIATARRRVERGGS